MYILAMIAYNLLFPLLYLLYLPFYLRKLSRRGSWRQGFWERFGIYKKEKKARLRAMGGPVWVHSVSVGETVAALSFIRKWQERDPSKRFVLSTTTSTGQLMARKRAPAGVEVIYFPVDAIPSLWRAFKVIQPSHLVIFEVEIWPNTIRMAKRRGIPVSLVNCRMSDNSSAGYAKHRWLFQKIFSCFKVIAVQTEQDAERVEAILGNRDTVTICGTMKFDQVPDRDGEDMDALLNRVFPEDRLVFCAASTHAPEEAIMARITKRLVADFPNFRVVLVPRHQERAPEVEEALKEEDISYILLTRLREVEGEQQVTMLVVNTTGELMNFLSACDISFTGKSLADYGGDGGHNIIEPAIFGKPVLHGPAMENFRDVAQIFRDDESAVQVADEAELEALLRKLIKDADERQRLGAAARKTVETRRGAIDRTIDLLTG